MFNSRPFELVRLIVVALITGRCAFAQTVGTRVMDTDLTSMDRGGIATAAVRNVNQLTPGFHMSKSARRAVESFGRLPLSFEANQGQTDSRVRFLSQGPGYTLFLAPNEAVLALRESRHSANASADVAHSSTVAMRFVGSNAAGSMSGLERLEGKSNYFIGNDPAKWRTDIPNYSKVRRQGLYPGVDLVYYGNQGRLEYDFMLTAGSDPRAIELAFELGDRGLTKARNHAARLRVDASGNLVVPLNGSEILLHKPTAYQLTTDHGERMADGNARHLIAAEYVMKPGGHVGIRLAPYDTTKALVIDPVLTYSSRLSGSGGIGSGIAVDGAGNVYVTGTTESFGLFPVVNQTPGACAGSCSSSFDVAFVTKINAAGNALVYSSLIGGSTSDQGNAIAVDSQGNAYLAGLTESSDFPRVNQIAGACAGSCGTAGSQDVFVTKINAGGNALVYSSVLGGSDNDRGLGIAVDSSGNAYLTGVADSLDFPVVNPIPGACVGTCSTNSNSQKAFVAEVNSAGTALVYSSNLAGSGFTIGSGIAVDGAGSAYVVGITISTDFPRVNQIAAACPGTCGSGSSDGFVTKVSPRGASLAYSSLFGGSGFDMGSAIAVDSSGNAYLTGLTQSGDFPQVNPINRACTKGCGAGGNAQGDAFVTKINSAGTAIIYSSLVGGEQHDEGTGIGVDSLGNAYLTGFTQSGNFPAVHQIKGACLGTCSKKSGSNAFVVEVDSIGGSLVYSTVIGGSAIDEGHAIAVDGSGNAYLTGFTQSSDFPTVNQISGACAGSGCGGASQNTFIIKVAP